MRTLRKHLYEEIIDYLSKIGEEINSCKPNNRRIARYKLIIQSYLESRILDYEDVIDTLLDCVRDGGDLEETFKKQLLSYGVDIVDKPNKPEMLTEYFYDLKNKDVLITAYKLVVEKGRCTDCRCYNCPFSSKNLSSEFSRHYVGSCENFGRTNHTVDNSPMLVENAKEFIKICEEQLDF